MTTLEALILGIIQGLTEFLPVSSSGHLVISQQLFGLEASSEQLLGFDLALHFGTLISVIAVFYRDIWKMIDGCLSLLGRVARKIPPNPPLQRGGHETVTSPFSKGGLRGISATLKDNEGAYLAFLVIVGTIPAAIIGIVFADFFRSLFDSALSAGVMLLVTGSILWATRFVKRSDRKLKDLCMRDALVVGCAQAFAILPGISRSGTTIATGLFSRWDRELAARYSFLLAVPAILGGIVFELESLSQWSVHSLAPLIVGVVAAALSGFIAIRWLLSIIQKGKFSYFAYYCWAVGLATLVWFGLFVGA